MVESTQKTAGHNMMSKNGCVMALMAYFSPQEFIKLQELNKRVYEVVSNVMPEVEIPSSLVVLERKRTEFYLTRIQACTELDQPYWKLFSIGDSDKPDIRQYCEATLGFKEVYFQFFIAMNDYTYYAWPLIEEAFVSDGFKLTFDSSWKLIESKKIASPPERLMRPTILKTARQSAKNLDHTHDLLFIGGVKERNSLYYNTKLDQWYWLPKLPAGHNITCNVACNWKDRALFTFVLDGQLNLKAAVLPLEQIDLQITKESQMAEMQWSLQIDAQTATDTSETKTEKLPVDESGSKHFIDRFHLKCATEMADGSIVVCARGRYPGMKEAVSTLFLKFDVVYDKKAEVQYRLKMKRNVQRCYPTVFPRQLDHMQRNNQNLILVQDTPDTDDFEVMVVQMDKLRERLTDCQVHKSLTCNKLVEKP